MAEGHGDNYRGRISMKPTVIKLHSLTPLWTGDLDRNSAQVRETSFVGSLRWWYREIIRSVDSESVCNVTSDNSAPEKKQICRVCQLFGCTGQARQFRVEIQDLSAHPLFFVTHNEVYVSNGNWLTRMWGGEKEGGRGRDAIFSFAKNSLYVKSPETFKMKILPRTPSEGEAVPRIKTLISFIARYGALGARTQNGFGQIAMTEKSEPATMSSLTNPTHEAFFSVTFELVGGLGRYRESTRFIGSPPPSSRDLNRALFIPCAFDLRFRGNAPGPSRFQSGLGLRPYFKQKGFDKETVEELFGRTGGNKSKSCIHVSHLYRQNPEEPFRLKVFGFVPEALRGKITGDAIRAVVESFFSSDEIFPNCRPVDKF